MNPSHRRGWLKSAGALVGAAGASALLPAVPGAALLDSLRGAGTASIDNPASAGARLPRFARIPGEGIVLSWVEPAGAEHRLVYAVRRANRWGAPVEVARGSRWFVNWADFPSVVPIDAQFWVAHWLVRRGEGKTYDYDIALAVSRDGGKSWSAPFAPHRDTAPAEHGFASIFALGDLAGIVWLDGRDFAQTPAQARAAGKSGNFALRYTTVARDGKLGPDTAIDDNVCTCCQTSAVSTSMGPVVAYRGRTSAEIRDNLVRRLVAGRWQKSSALGPDGWRIAACPTNGPALAARSDGICAAWYTGANDRGRVLAAISNDSGSTFGRTIELDARDPVGRVAAEWIDERFAAVAWIGAPDPQGAAPLLWCRINRDGGSDTPRRIATVSAERQSGFPQIALSGGRLLVAWTDAQPAAGLRTAALDPQ